MEIGAVILIPSHIFLMEMHHCLLSLCLLFSLICCVASHAQRHERDSSDAMDRGRGSDAYEKGKKTQEEMMKEFERERQEFKSRTRATEKPGDSELYQHFKNGTEQMDKDQNKIIDGWRRESEERRRRELYYKLGFAAAVIVVILIVVGIWCCFYYCYAKPKRRREMMEQHAAAQKNPPIDPYISPAPQNQQPSPAFGPSAPGQPQIMVIQMPDTAALMPSNAAPMPIAAAPAPPPSPGPAATV
jgi:hypothetical protein